MAGKGDKPRSCFSRLFKDNFDAIKWSKKSKIKRKISCKGAKKSIKYS